MNIKLLIIQVIWLLLPAGFANMAPIIAKKIFPNWNKPIDHGKLWKGHEIFGPHKTYRGFISGIIVGLLVFYLQQTLYTHYTEYKHLSYFNYENISVLFGAWMGFCALLGDLIKSFFKRRFHIAPGAPWIFFDQVDWIMGALFSITTIYIPKIEIIAMSLIIGVLLHLIIRRMAYFLGIVSEPL